jgi:hypothetical protein
VIFLLSYLFHAIMPHIFAPLVQCPSSDNCFCTFSVSSGCAPRLNIITAPTENLLNDGIVDTLVLFAANTRLIVFLVKDHGLARMYKEECHDGDYGDGIMIDRNRTEQEPWIRSAIFHHTRRTF